MSSIFLALCGVEELGDVLLVVGLALRSGDASPSPLYVRDGLQPST